MRATVEKGHGRFEIRRLAAPREAARRLDWPGAAQVCRIERIRERAGKKPGREVSCIVTSLSRARAAPDGLLVLIRGHWGIENRLHRRRDVGLREDASRIRTGNVPQALAALRNTVPRLVEPLSEPLAAIREAFAENRLKAIETVKYGVL